MGDRRAGWNGSSSFGQFGEPPDHRTRQACPASRHAGSVDRPEDPGRSAVEREHGRSTPRPHPAARATAPAAAQSRYPFVCISDPLYSRFATRPGERRTPREAQRDSDQQRDHPGQRDDSAHPCDDDDGELQPVESSAAPGSRTRLWPERRHTTGRGSTRERWPPKVATVHTGPLQATTPACTAASQPANTPLRKARPQNATVTAVDSRSATDHHGRTPLRSRSASTFGVGSRGSRGRHIPQVQPTAHGRYPSVGGVGADGSRTATPTRTRVQLPARLRHHGGPRSPRYPVVPATTCALA